VQVALEYFFARNYQEAAASARQALAVDATTQFASGILCVNLGRLGNFDEAAAECTKALSADGHAAWIADYLHEYRTRGYDAATAFLAKKALSDILTRREPDLWKLANAYVTAGMPDEALPILFKGLKAHEPGLLQIRVDPDFDGIRSDPRYVELVRQIGFPSE
jgi:tetratricopeptide (TPR) repeat protein